MATLLLTAVGSAIAGPIGAAIGAMAGQRVDQALFGPKGSRGARLSDLAVQSSSYGASIPRIYGRMRVSGTVIWSTDLREERSKVSQGKGRPKATVYSYSASFAVLLSARPISGIGRIWADGKLLRGTAGDFKVETDFRIHNGASDQPVDPLIASAEGGATPGYRGRAYAVFEDMALDSFGNRIPNLSFEVFAEAAGVTAQDIIVDLGGPHIEATGGPLLDGYVADGESVAAALAPLNDIVGFDWIDGGTTLHVGTSGLPITAVDDAALGAAPELSGGPLLRHQRAASASLPSRVELGFADTERDFQPGLQTLDLHSAGRVLHTDLPAALPTDVAARLARETLFAGRRKAASTEIQLPWRYLSAWAAASLALKGRQWTIRSVGMEGMSLIFHLSPTPALPTAPLPVDGGRIVSETDLETGPTTLILADLPAVQDTAATSPVVVVAAAGNKPGWRSAVLMQRAGPHAVWEDAGRTTAPAIMGVVGAALPMSSPHLFDLRASLMIDLLHDGMALQSAGDDALFAGANLALIGDELVQFGIAERVGSGRWAVSRLLRGRRGTEAAMQAHGPGERFVLLDADALTPLALPVGAGTLDVLAKGVGDAVGVTANLTSIGAALRPLSPVHLRVSLLSDGGLEARWIRRSREGWHWPDAIDVAIGEEQELYRIDVAAGPIGVASSLLLSAPYYRASAAQIDELRAGGARSVEISVRQVGRFALSAPMTATLPL